MKATIIIPVPEINAYIREALPHYAALTHRDFEILILPDALPADDIPGARILPTGPVGPAKKRDRGAAEATGEILAFIDDDAYPAPDWLDHALAHFEDPAIGAVGGPAITPNSDAFWQRVSGATFLSRLSGGFPERYWPVGQARDIEDWPTVNFLVRRDLFLTLGGFETRHWPGEDTLLCLKIIESGSRIVYEPRAKVWHHRRADLRRHLLQVGNYGLHRGHFARVYPRTSLRPLYLLPTLWLLFIGFSLAAWPLFPPARPAIAAGFAAYALALAAASFDIWRRQRQLSVALGAILFIVPTHLAYGLAFLIGALAPKIDTHREDEG